MVAELDLKRADAWDRARRSTDFGGEVGLCRKVVAEESRRAGKALSGELHSVTRIPCETDDYLIQFLAISPRLLWWDDLGRHF